MQFVEAKSEDFDEAYSFICALWYKNIYDRETIRKVYEEVLADENTFCFFLEEDGKYTGFCQGDYFNTFWMSGLTCYVSGIITKEGGRKQGRGKTMMDHVKELAGARGCKAIILDSAFFRPEAHAFYEGYGFEKSCYGFELALDEERSSTDPEMASEMMS